VERRKGKFVITLEYSAILLVGKDADNYKLGAGIRRLVTPISGSTYSSIWRTTVLFRSAVGCLPPPEYLAGSKWFISRIIGMIARGTAKMTDKIFQTIGEAILPHFDPGSRKQALDRLAKMIDYAIRRQDWYEDQRNKALVLGIGLLGLASFLVTGLLSPAAEALVYFRFCAGATLIAITGTAIAIIAEYTSGASESYTHRSLADIRSWFFAYVVKEPVANAAVQNTGRQAENQEILLNAWKAFVSGWLEYAERTQSVQTKGTNSIHYGPFLSHCGPIGPRPWITTPSVSLIPVCRPRTTKLCSRGYGNQFKVRIIGEDISGAPAFRCPGRSKISTAPSS